MCCDVSVLRSADCWTDNNLLRGQLKVHFPVKKPRITMRRRFAVGALKEDKVREMYCEEVCNSVCDKKLGQWNEWVREVGEGERWVSWCS